MVLPNVGAITPLCGPHVATTLTASNSVSVVNVARGVTVARFLIMTTPLSIFADAPSSSVLVGARGTSDLFRIDLDAGQVLTTGTPGEVYGIASTRDRLFLVTRPDAGTLELLTVLDRSGVVLASSLRSDSSLVGSLIAYDQLRGAIYTGSVAFSPARLAAWARDGGTLVPLRSSSSVGSGGKNLSLSPDSMHLAYATGSGNQGYVVTDLNPVTFTGTSSWNTGAYPAGAAFNPGSTLFASSNSTEVILFNVATHAERARFSFPSSPCQSPRVEQVEFSRGGSYLFALASCLSPPDTSAIFWTPLF